MLEPGLRTTCQLQASMIPAIDSCGGAEIAFGYNYHLKYYAVPNKLSINKTLHGNLMFALQAPKFVGRGIRSITSIKVSVRIALRFANFLPQPTQIVWTIYWEQVHQPRDGPSTTTKQHSISPAEHANEKGDNPRWQLFAADWNDIVGRKFQPKNLNFPIP